MAKMKKEFLTPKWLEIKLMYETGTNGSDKYGTNFEINGELDKLTRDFIDIIGEFTREFGWDCIIENVKMDLWKERIWSLVENAGLLPEIAWKDDLAKDIAKAEADTEDDIWEIDEEQIEKEIYGNL
jgi:hypothetical protein|tara:strand:+ start:175 stop:555 length:381 start_codon:yes stop_codon:yes gene_type:complete